MNRSIELALSWPGMTFERLCEVRTHNGVDGVMTRQSALDKGTVAFLSQPSDAKNI